MIVHTKLEYECNIVTHDKKRNFKSPDDLIYQNQKLKIKTSEEGFRFQRRSK